MSATEGVVDEAPAAQVAADGNKETPEQATEAAAAENSETAVAETEENGTTAEPAVEAAAAEPAPANPATTETAEAAAAGDAAVQKPNILKTTARADTAGDYSKNNKFNPQDQPTTDDPEKIRSQVGTICSHQAVATC